MTSIKRKILTIGEKAAIIQAIESGISNSEVAKKFNSRPSTVSTILKNKEIIQKSLQTTTLLKRKRIRNSNFNDIEEELFKWHENQKSQGITINGPMLQMQANLIGQSLGKHFHCTESWIYRFRMRHNIVLRKNLNEELSNESVQQQGKERVEEEDWIPATSQNIKFEDHVVDNSCNINQCLEDEDSFEPTAKRVKAQDMECSQSKELDEEVTERFENTETSTPTTAKKPKNKDAARISKSKGLNYLAIKAKKSKNKEVVSLARSSKSKELDSLDFIGKIWTNKLSKIPIKARLNIEKQINDAIYESEISTLFEEEDVDFTPSMLAAASVCSKVWNDWKSQIRKKMTAISSEKNSTDEGQLKQQFLTATEKIVARVAGIHSFEQPDQADDSHSNFGSFSNMEARPIQQVVEGNELFTILEPVPVRPSTSRDKPPSAKRQKRTASERPNDSCYSESIDNFENAENMENIEQMENMENMENIENIPPNYQQTVEYPKWKEERYDLFGKIALMKLHDITSDAQRIFAEKIMYEALSLAELDLLTSSHAISAPFMPIRPPLINKQFTRAQCRDPVVTGAVGNKTPPRNQDNAATENTRVEPEVLQENIQTTRTSLDTNVVSPTPPPPLAKQQQNQNVNIPKTTTTPAQSDLKMPTTSAVNAPTKDVKIERHSLDASDAFGEHVAAKHRQYATYIKSYVEHSISTVLFEADMGRYDPPPPEPVMQPKRPPAAQADTGTNKAATSSAAAYNAARASAAARNKPATVTVPQAAITSAMRAANSGTAYHTSATAYSSISTQPSTSTAYRTSASYPTNSQPSTSTAAQRAAAAAAAAGSATNHSRTSTAQHSNAATSNNEQPPHILDPNFVIKSSPAHTPSYSSDIDDNDDESETVLSNTGAPPYVTNERMSDDEEEILSYDG